MNKQDFFSSIKAANLHIIFLSAQLLHTNVNCDYSVKTNVPYLIFHKLEDLKVLKRSPDLLNNVKIGQGQNRLIVQMYFVLPYMGSGHFDQVTFTTCVIRDRV